MFNTNRFFTPGKLSVLLDGGAGSSGKGKLESFLCAHADNWQFACCTFGPQAGHWTKLDDGRAFFYQTFNSCAYEPDRYEKLYIGPGATIELPAFWREIGENKIPLKKIGISPLASILQNIDGEYERGLCDLDGSPTAAADGGYLAKTGTTAHGCGVNRARRVLRRPEAKFARDIPELAEMICDVPSEIMDRLDAGQAGMLSIAQGFQLSYMLPEFYPHTTSRNVSVAAGFDDMMLPVHYAGNVVLNFRTFPIRINNNKYICKSTGRHLTWAEVNEAAKKIEPWVMARDLINDTWTAHGLDTVGVKVVEGSSGPGYDDQLELTWRQLTHESGSPTPIMEMTSVTKLPRRVFTFSRENLIKAIRHNRANGKVFVSINFMDYVDHAIAGRRGYPSLLTPKAEHWLNLKCHDIVGDIRDAFNPTRSVGLMCIGTGPLTDDKIVPAEMLV